MHKEKKHKKLKVSKDNMKNIFKPVKNGDQIEWNGDKS